MAAITATRSPYGSPGSSNSGGQFAGPAMRTRFAASPASDVSFSQDLPTYMAAIHNGTWTDDGSLPPNWEELIDKSTGRQYYVDHDTETTSWVDPRDVFFKPSDFDKCHGEEFAFGWESSNDASCGEYYVDHKTWSTTLHDPRTRMAIQIGQGGMIGLTPTSGQQELARAETDLLLLQEALNKAPPLTERSIHVQTRITAQLKKIRVLEDRAELESRASPRKQEDEKVRAPLSKFN